VAPLDKVSSGLTKVRPKLRSDRELARFMRESIQPIAPEVADETLNEPLSMLDPPAIDLRQESQLALLSSFHSPTHQALFRELREDKVINRFGFSSEGVSNTFCNTPDAEIYAAMILDRRPPRVIEVGSGFSTLVARKRCRSHARTPRSSSTTRSRGLMSSCGRRAQPDACLALKRTKREGGPVFEVGQKV
jgi:hypothetical protein